MSMDCAVNSDFVTEVKSFIESGVHFDLTSEPRHTHLPNTSAVYDNKPFVRERIHYYRTLRALSVLSQPPSIVHPLHVVTKDGRKQRLVLDLSKNLNQFIPQIPFRYQSLSDAVSMASPGCWFAKIDISNCFLSFPVSRRCRDYLNFEFEGVFYRFDSMPFGLSAAPGINELLLAVVDFEFKRRGIRHIRYCDDFLIMHNTQAGCRKNLSLALSILREFGLVPKDSKTVGPARRLEFLGVGIDSVKQTLFCTPQRVKAIISLLAELRNLKRTKVRHIQSVVGKLSFAAQVLPGARPFMRRFIDLIRGRLSGHWVTIDAAARRDAGWWCSYLSVWNGRMRWRLPQGPTIAHDASLEGFGFVLEEAAGLYFPPLLSLNCGISGCWDECHRKMVASSGDIQWAELFAIVYALHCFAPFIRDSSVTLITDNIADVAIINRQSTKNKHLLVLLRALYATATDFNIYLTAIHRSGVDNIIPDALSRVSIHRFCPSNVSCARVTFVRSGDLRMTQSATTTGKLSSFSADWL
jgi:hypothetical protein